MDITLIFQKNLIILYAQNVIVNLLEIKMLIIKINLFQQKEET